MSLTTNDQLALLLDLLDEQSGECCGNVSEYQQIKRLVHSMLKNDQLNGTQLAEVLPDIYDYSNQGERVTNVPEHITAHQDNLAQWIGEIEQFTAK
ncbi:YtzH-like family protein [Oceanobacillus kapialis]|uniref:YtzH-like family protein n=1 Tax=Oceanobacillus kapialis TaxID=481353 RepID=A0ABW5Q4P8_9BACI